MMQSIVSLMHHYEKHLAMCKLPSAFPSSDGVVFGPPSAFRRRNSCIFMEQSFIY